jgi:hypothetical protein
VTGTDIEFEKLSHFFQIKGTGPILLGDGAIYPMTQLGHWSRLEKLGRRATFAR